MAPLKTKAYLTNVHLCAERGKAQAQLQEAVKGKQGGDRKSDEIKRHGVPNDPTVSSNGHPQPKGETAPQCGAVKDPTLSRKEKMRHSVAHLMTPPTANPA